MDPGQFFIYGLRDPRNGEIRYVGQTTIGLRRTASYSHSSSIARHGNRHLARWLLQLMPGGPETVVLESLAIGGLDRPAQRAALNAAEIAWVAMGRAALGRRLLNATIGGAGMNGHKFSAKSKAKMRRSALALAKTAKRKAQLKAMCEKSKTPEVRARTGAATRAFYKSDAGQATLARLSVKRKQIATTAHGKSHLKRITEATKTPEAIAKQAQAMRARAATNEGHRHLEQLRALQHTPEAQAKQRKSLAAFWRSAAGKKRRTVAAAQMTGNQNARKRPWADGVSGTVIAAWRAALSLSKRQVAALLGINARLLRNLEEIP